MVGKLRQFTALYSNGGHVKTYAPGDSLIGRQNTETNWQEKIVRKTKAKFKKKLISKDNFIGFISVVF